LIQRGARHLHTFSATERVPRAAGTAVSRAAGAATTVSNFNGTSSRDSQFTNYNLEFEPPDQGLCEANGFVLEPVNSAYRIFRTNGRTLRGPFNVNDLFNVGGQEFTSDPRCWYDPATTTWFSIVVFISGGGVGNQGTVLIAVRHAKDPLGLWNEYSIDATDPGGRGCPCFGDQPRIGIDQQNLYITADQFSILGPQFDGGELWVIDKAGLVAGNPTVKFVHFGGLRIAGRSTLAPQPALSTVPSPASASGPSPTGPRSPRAACQPCLASSSSPSRTPTPRRHRSGAPRARSTRATTGCSRPPSPATRSGAS